MSNLFQQAVKLLGITSIRASAYHPQSQGALERFYAPLKNTMRIYCLLSMKGEHSVLNVCRLKISTEIPKF